MDRIFAVYVTETMAPSLYKPINRPGGRASQSFAVNGSTLATVLYEETPFARVQKGGFTLRIPAGKTG